jgi:hypothetical protein
MNNTNISKLKKLDAFLKKNNMTVYSEGGSVRFYTKDMKDYEYHNLTMTLGIEEPRSNGTQKYSYVHEHEDILKNAWLIENGKLVHKVKSKN